MAQTRCATHIAAPISIAGIFIGSMWFAYVKDRKPRTLNAQWEKATAKYRAAQNQDPISALR